MSPLKQKVKLSPRLGLGVGRASNRGSLLPYATMIVLVISGVLGIRAINLAIKGSHSDIPKTGAVLGAVDTQTPKQMFKEYSVKKGDTVFSIGQQHNIEWTTLATLNGLEAPFKLTPGQVIKIPQQ